MPILYIYSTETQFTNHLPLEGLTKLLSAISNASISMTYSLQNFFNQVTILQTVLEQYFVVMESVLIRIWENALPRVLISESC